jgi:hypothetical protein
MLRDEIKKKLIKKCKAKQIIIKKIEIKFLKKNIRKLVLLKRIYVKIEEMRKKKKKREKTSTRHQSMHKLHHQ